MGNSEAVLETYAQAAQVAQSAGLDVNAGHDLNLQNTGKFCQIPGLLEVSIGHALVADALEIGPSQAARAYLDVLHNTSGEVAASLAGDWQQRI